MKAHFLHGALLLTILLGGIQLPAHAQNFTQVTAGPIVNDGGWCYGCGWGDYDGDGFDDLFVVNNYSADKDNFLYRNNGDGTFAKITSDIVVNDGGSSYGCAWGDYDNDSHPDLFVANYNENNFLYRNNGDGSFTKITTGAIVTNGGGSTCPAWGDYDNDGYLDLYVCNRTSANFLYHNEGDGTFTRILTGLIATENRNSGACAWGDYDGDGYLDLYVANAGPDYNSLFHNEGDGTFTKISGDPSVSFLESCDCVTWGDYDNDGDLDLLTAPGMLPGSAYDLYLFNNQGDGSFVRVPGLPHAGINSGGGSGMIDYDNDGDLDIFLAAYDGTRNVLLENDGSGGFTQITSGVLVSSSNYNKGTSWADCDRDGDLDVFIARNNYFGGNNRFFLNDGNANHWCEVTCRGIESNAMGIGAVVALTAEIGGTSVTQTHQISAQTGGGTSSQNAVTAHFGLGDADLVLEVTVSWPSGSVDTYHNLPVDQRLDALEGAGAGDVSELPAPGGLGLRTLPSVIGSAAELAFDLPDADEVRLGIYDAQGRLIETLLARPLSAGPHRVVWRPREAGTGTCFCRLRAGSRQEALRLIVLK
jgi:enediyne biosynthesis protein E4